MYRDLVERLCNKLDVQDQFSILLEKKSWEQIALALYGVLDDISTSTTDDVREVAAAFRNMVMKHQMEKNQYLYSPDGYKVKRVDEKEEDDIDSAALSIAVKKSKIAQDMYGKSYADLTSEEAEIVDRELNESKLSEGTVDHARRELMLAGLFDKDSGYDGMLAEAVLELMELFASQEHSGCSAAMTRELFNKLSNFETLTELTDNLDEWMDVAESSYGVDGVKDHPPIWQSRRNPGAFSNDGGKTYYDIDDDSHRFVDENGISFTGRPEDHGGETTIYTSKHIVGKD